MTKLMKAVKSNDVVLVKELIRQGVDVNELDSSGDAPIIIAAYKGYTPIVKLLLEAGADVSVVDPEMKATALHAAAYAGHADVVELLLVHHIEIDKQGPYNGYTALHDAVWQNRVDVVRVLLEGGARVEIKSKEGKTPLDLARAGHRSEIVAILEHKRGTV